MIGKLLCSTGAFSRDPDLTDPEDIVRHMNMLDCDGFELIFYPSFYNDIGRFTETFLPASSRIHSLHTEKSIGPMLGDGDDEHTSLALERFRLNADFAATLGIRRLVLHLWGLPESDTCIERNLSHLAQCIEIAAAAGCTLTIESIPCLTSTPLTHLREIGRRYADARFTLDTEFLAMHDEVDEAFGDGELLARTEHVHLKDFGGSLTDEEGKRVYLHPGEGKIDFRHILTAIDETEHTIDLCLESTSVSDSGEVRLNMVQRDLFWLGDAVNAAKASVQ